MTVTRSPITRSRLSWLWAATLWPPVYMVLFMGYWLWNVFGITRMATAGPESMDVFFVSFAVMGVFHVATMLVQLVLMAVYIWLVLEVELQDNARLLWGVLVVFTGFIGQIFFLLRVVGPQVEPRALHTAHSG